MDTSALDYLLPPELIAQDAVEPRDHARLLVTALGAGTVAHQQVRDLTAWLRPGDLLIRNRTRVIPARLAGHKASGGAVEVLLIHARDHDPTLWRCMIRGKVQVGTAITIATATCMVVALHDDGTRDVRFPPDQSALVLAEAHGHIPLPPYIRRTVAASDRQRYQTVFAAIPGSVAAPTAGLHFTTELFDRLAAMGVTCAEVELAIGPGTFKPIDRARIEDFRIHAERGVCPAATVAAIARCKAAGGRVIAIGTTSVRVLESAARQPGGFAAWSGWTELYLHPPQQCKIADGLLTNFHLPRSSLLLLVGCLTGIDRLLELYRLAIAERYRFYSYGDAMLILP